MRCRRFFLLVLTYFVVFWRLRDPQPACLSNLGPLPPVGRHSFLGALNPDSILFPFIPPSFLRILCQVALNCQLQLHRRSFHIQPTVKRLEIVPDPRRKGTITLITKAPESLPCRFAKYDRIVPALVSLCSGTLSPTPLGFWVFFAANRKGAKDTIVHGPPRNTKNWPVISVFVSPRLLGSYPDPRRLPSDRPCTVMFCLNHNP